MSDQFIGIDVGGTKIACATLQAGELSESHLQHTELSSGDKLVDQLITAVEKARTAETRAVAIGVPMYTNAAGILTIVQALLGKGLPSIADDQANFITSTQFSVGKGQLRFGVAGLLYTTVLSSVFALLLAVPLAIAGHSTTTAHARYSGSRPPGMRSNAQCSRPPTLGGSPAD